MPSNPNQDPSPATQQRLVVLEDELNLLLKQRPPSKTGRSVGPPELEAQIETKRQRIDYCRRRERTLEQKRALKDKPEFVVKRRAYTDREATKQRRRAREKAAYKTDPAFAAKKRAESARRRETHGDQCRAVIREWKKRNPKYDATYVKARKQTDPVFGLQTRVRRRICHALTGFSKSAHTAALIGCTWLELRRHIESLFKPGMSWENRSEWHVDHKLPCKAFDLSDPEQQRKCFHFTNLQPLWKMDNLRKSAKILPEHC